MIDGCKSFRVQLAQITKNTLLHGGARVYPMALLTKDNPMSKFTVRKAVELSLFVRERNFST